jgi:hypothetical protein
MGDEKLSPLSFKAMIEKVSAELENVCRLGFYNLAVEGIEFVGVRGWKGHFSDCI